MEGFDSLSADKRHYNLTALPIHLGLASQATRLQRILTSFDFLEAKVHELGPQPLIDDFDLISLPELVVPVEVRQCLLTVQEALRRSAYIVMRDRSQLAGQLLGHLLGSPYHDLDPLLQQARQWQDAPWLGPLTPSLTPPGSPLLRSLQVHSGTMPALAATPDGQRAFAASDDGMVTVWDLTRLADVASTKARSTAINAVAVVTSGQRQYILSGSDDGIVTA